MNTELLMRQLEIDEGNVLRVHVDRLGRKTVGIGHRDESLNLGDKITKNKVHELFLMDLSDTVQLSVQIFLDCWDEMRMPAQEVILNIVFNLKKDIIKQLPEFVYQMHIPEYEQAADTLRNSAWAKQYPARANRLARKLEDLV